MPHHTISVAASGYQDATGLDTGVSHALLERVAAVWPGDALRAAYADFAGLMGTRVRC